MAYSFEAVLAESLQPCEGQGWNEPMFRQKQEIVGSQVTDVLDDRLPKTSCGDSIRADASGSCRSFFPSQLSRHALGKVRKLKGE